MNRRVSLRTVLLSVLGLGAAVLMVAVFLAFSGLVLTSARPQHAEITRLVLHGTFKQSVSHRAADMPAPPENLDDPGMIALGAQHYALVCSSCHGGPGLGQSPVALSMRPSPQHLASVVGQFDDRELFAVIRDGVRFSAMPAWPATGNFDEIWPVVAFLRQLPGMSAEDYARLTAEPEDVPETRWRDRGQLAALEIDEHPEPVTDYMTEVPSTGWRPLGLTDVPLATCARCHGVDGSGAPTGGQAPNIAIHGQAFLEQRLRDYADGIQPSGIMTNVASSLSETQIAAVSEYFAGLPAKGMEAADIPAETLDTGRQIALMGLPDVAVPACGSCHSAAAREAKPAIPALAGQSAAFIERRLQSYADVALATDTTRWNPMHDYAERMSDEQRHAVSAYLASLDASDPLTPERFGEMPDNLAMTDLGQQCISCHGPDMTGLRDSSVSPNLSLQAADYIYQQLNLFNASLREGQLMTSDTHKFDAEQLSKISAWIGALPAKGDTKGSSSDAADDILRDVGRIAKEGDQGRGIPACDSCHGEEVVRGATMIPRLNGQSAEYMKSRLDHFADIESHHAGPTPMQGIALALTSDERAGLAEWFARMPVITQKPGPELPKFEPKIPDIEGLEKGKRR